MVDKLEACPNPWCEGKEGVTASQHIVTGKWHICCDDCMIDGPWADSHGAAIVAWNTRPTPANGEQVERVARAICIAEEHDPDGPHPEDAAEGRKDGFPLHVFYYAAARAAIAAMNPTSTEDARARVKVLEEGRQIVTDGYRCRTCAAVFVADHKDSILGGHPDNGCAHPNWDKLTEEQQAEAITALGNKETDRHG